MRTLLASLMALLGANLALANEFSYQGTEQSQPSVFAQDYLTLEISRNFPVSFSQDRLEPGEPHPVIGYRHRFNHDWLMGVGSQFRIFERANIPENSENSGTLAIWTVYHEMNYALRLDHPTYLLVGPRMLYLLPAQAAKLPLQRDQQFQTEIGAGLAVSVVRIMNEKYMLTARVERWRGTRTMQLHGLEVAFGVNLAI